MKTYGWVNVFCSLLLSLYSSLLGLGRVFSSVIFFTQSVGLLSRVISPSQGRYLHTGQHKYRINAHTDIMPWVGFETTIPEFERAKTVHVLDHLRPRGHCDRHHFTIGPHILSRSKWPHGLRHGLSSPVGILGSWFRTPLEVWMFVHVYSVWVVLCR
jgi:hypothetical protein